MEIKVQTMQRCAVVALSGEADHAAAPELEQRLFDLIQAASGNLVINLLHVTYISSAGLRALVSAQAKARQKVPRGDIVLSELSPISKRTLELVGFHHLFEFYETDAEAVGSL
jgi:anti-anti-sigma factor